MKAISVMVMLHGVSSSLLIDRYTSPLSVLPAYGLRSNVIVSKVVGSPQ